MPPARKDNDEDSWVVTEEEAIAEMTPAQRIAYNKELKATQQTGFAPGEAEVSSALATLKKNNIVLPHRRSVVHDTMDEILKGNMPFNEFLNNTQQLMAERTSIRTLDFVQS